jgi:hypothetical protein
MPMPDPNRPRDADQQAAPESTALGGPVPPAAEAPPTVRDRLTAVVAGTWTIFAAGAILLLAAVLAPDHSGSQGYTALAGAAVIALGAFTLLGVLNRFVVGAACLLGGVALGISALLPDPFGLAEVGRLLAGAALFMAAAGLLATGASPAQSDRQPEPKATAR